MYHPSNTNLYGVPYNPNIEQNYGYPTAFNYSNISNNDAIPLITIEAKGTEEKNIEEFLLTVEQLNEFNDEKAIVSGSNIGKTKNALASIFKLNKKLEEICTELNNDESLSEDAWEKKVIACKELKEEISRLMKPLNDPKYLNQLKRDIEKRKKKRLREKVKREQWKNEKLLRTERRARLHAEIDSWIRKEQAVIDKEKQEENLRKDADMILSDVRGKRSDARKYLGILKELQHLRNIKANIAKARGEHLSSAADEAFNNIIAKLTEQWLTLDREYSIEEQGLKLMLKTDNDKRIEKQKKNVFDDWECVLFGKKMLSSDQFYPDINTFFAIRCAWDKYISLENDASPIPIGWVLPDKPSSAAWQKCLEKDVP